MDSINAGDAGPINLSDLTFRAKIDFVTVRTPGKVQLRKLLGKPRWARSEHYKKLTIHDAAPEDVRVLVQDLANPASPNWKSPSTSATSPLFRQSSAVRSSMR
ncbi:hypothetical protein [Ramlibacter montanisoli]|uniref:Uncharacterized protein n=1 Tax=Ramlibacter montanisoli TaxID=2732512 RepID=A0A849KHN1_9BURK|nr:hypothetical protein [Ramlibacter montanisoli]NNU43573.1 hypothetical protein [Ramlibacter montanisoli]